MLKIKVYKAVLKEQRGWMCWHMPMIQALGKLRQGNYEVEGHPGPYSQILSQKKKKSRYKELIALFFCN